MSGTPEHPGREPGTCWGELGEEAKLGEGLLVVEARDLLGEGKGMGHLIPVASQRQEQNFFCYTGRSLNAASAEDLNRQKMKIYPNSKFIWQASCIFFFSLFNVEVEKKYWHSTQDWVPPLQRPL